MTALPVYRTWLHRLVDRVQLWCVRNLGQHAPDELIDPDGLGLLWRQGNHRWTLREAAYRLGMWDEKGRLLWRDVVYDVVWMRERDGEWWETEWRARDALKFPRWQPVSYAYLTPPPDGPVAALDRQEAE